MRAQRIAESLLRGKCGAAVALNPKTGGIYAMASSPTYDPNLVEKPGGYARIQATKAPCAPSAPLLNRATQGLYPPGSTFKTITAAAALDDGVYTQNSTFYDPGYCTEYGKKISNAENPDQNGPEAYGNVTLAEAYQHSINAVFCMVGMKLGAAKILDEAKKFGFYSVPPLETPSDSRSPSGLYNQKTRKPFDPKNPDAAVDPGRLAFGQERMLVTPLQMAMVAATIANGGVEMEPHLVKKVLSPRRLGSSPARTRRCWRTATKPKTAAAIKALMISVVQAGTGTAAQIPGVVVGGKTGTAETGASHVYDAWFIFFAPAVHPVVAGAVVVENQLNGFGGAIAAPIAKAIMQAILPPCRKRSRRPMAKDAFLDDTFDNRYLILRKLGAGGMADVYLAEDEELGRNVALKMLNDRHARDDQFVERFRREAQNAAGLNHPNIVSIFDRGQGEDTYYIAMEYLKGRSLKELLVRNGPTPIPIAIDYARQILSALAFAHRNGIVHRDIKPHNIVVGGDGRLKVTDFGIARSGASQMTEAGSIVGTAQYLSPEQARGAPVDPRSDLYSLGIVLYEMLTGQVPFTGDAPVEIAMKHLTAIPEPPSKLRPDVPHDLDAIVMRALAKDPDQRYASAEEMDADLGRIARGLGVSPRTEEAMTQVLSGVGVAVAPTVIEQPRAVAPPPPPAPPAYRPPGSYYNYDGPTRQRSPWPWLLGLLAVVIAAGAGYLLYQKIQSQLAQAKTVAVDNVGLEKEALAKENLIAEGLQVAETREANDNVPSGAVISQDPAAGLRVARNSIVTLHVSTGKRRVRVPSVTGYLAHLGAISTLTNRGPAVEPGGDLQPRRAEHRDRAGSEARDERRRGHEGAHQLLAGPQAGCRSRRRRRDVRGRPEDPRGSRLERDAHRCRLAETEGPGRPAESERGHASHGRRERRALGL